MINSEKRRSAMAQLVKVSITGLGELCQGMKDVRGLLGEEVKLAKRLMVG